MKAIVYSGPGWSWCDRVKVLLQDNEYEIEEIQINRESIQEIKEKYNQDVRSIPQVIIDGEFVGGFAEVESMIKGPSSINKI